MQVTYWSCIVLVSPMCLPQYFCTYIVHYLLETTSIVFEYQSYRAVFLDSPVCPSKKLLYPGEANHLGHMKKCCLSNGKFPVSISFSTIYNDSISIKNLAALYLVVKLGSGMYTILWLCWKAKYSNQTGKNYDRVQHLLLD